jgi:hypothetical protein
VVGIVINHDVVTIPKPIVGVSEIGRCELKEETAKAETLRASAAQAPHVLWTKAAVKVPMLPGMVDVIIYIAASRVMAYPAIIFRVDVRSFWMAPLVAISGMALLWWCAVCGRMGRGSMRRRGAVCGNVTATNAMFIAMLRWSSVLWRGAMLFMALLRKRGKTSDQYHHPQESKKSNEFFGAYIRNGCIQSMHISLPFEELSLCKMHKPETSSVSDVFFLIINIRARAAESAPLNTEEKA